MTAEELNEMRDRNCPEWLCDQPSDDSLKKRIKELEIIIEKLKNDLSNNKYMAQPQQNFKK